MDKVIDKDIKIIDKKTNKRAYLIQKGEVRNPKGRPKGSTKENKTKNILQDAFIKRRKEVKHMKIDKLSTLVAGFVPKEDTLKHEFVLPALSITTQGAYSSPYIDIDDAIVIDSHSMSYKEGVHPTHSPIQGEGVVGDTLPICTQPILNTLTNSKGDIKTLPLDTQANLNHLTESKSE